MSATPRLFVKADLSEDAPVALDEDQGNYLFRVLRLKQGDTVRIFNGRDGEWHAIVDEVFGKVGVLRTDRQLRSQGSIADIHLLFAPLKKAQTDYVVEKATELGAALLQPVFTDFTQASRVRSDRLEKIAREAAEQTERMEAPPVLEAERLFDLLQDWHESRVLFYCDEAGDDPHQDWGGQAGRAEPFLSVLKARKPGPAAILIGPEGGFSPAERELLRAQEHVVPVTLGPRILRAETAVVAALTLWQALLGDWGD